MQTAVMILLILGFVFSLLGIIFLIINTINRKKAQKTLSWPVVNGAIMKSEIMEHASEDEDGLTTTTYEPVVEYTYQVMGQSHTSRRIAYGANRFDRRTATRMVEQYPQGGTVKVHFDSNKPAESVLETAVAGGKVFQIVGYIFLAVGVVCILVGMVL